MYMLIYFCSHLWFHKKNSIFYEITQDSIDVYRPVILYETINENK